MIRLGLAHTLLERFEARSRIILSDTSFSRMVCLVSSKPAKHTIVWALIHPDQIPPADEHLTTLGGVDGGGALLAHHHRARDVEDGCLQASRDGEVDGEGEQPCAIEVDQGRALARTACSAVPTSRTRPSSTRSATRADIVTLVTPTSRASCARLVEPGAQRLEHQERFTIRRPSAGSTADEVLTRRGVGVMWVSKLY